MDGISVVARVHIHADRACLFCVCAFVCLCVRLGVCFCFVCIMSFARDTLPCVLCHVLL